MFQNRVARLTAGASLFLSALSGAHAATIYEKDPVFVQQTELQTGEARVYTSVIDHKRGYLYLLTNQSPMTVVKFRLATDSTPLARVGSVTLEAADGVPYGDCAALDVERGYLYIGTHFVTPSKIVKIRIGEGDDAPVRVGNVELNPGEIDIYGLAYDPLNQFGYAVCSADPGVIVKFAGGDGDALPTRVGALNLPANFEYPYPLAIDPARGKGWCAAYGASGKRLFQITLGAGSAAPTLDPDFFEYDTLDKDSGTYRLRYDPLTQILYAMGDYTDAGEWYLAKFDVSDTIRSIGRQMASEAQWETAGIGVDFASGLAFTSGDKSDTQLTKTFLGERLSGTGLLASVPVPPSTNVYIESVEYDPKNRFVYLICDEYDPARIYIFRQPAGDGPDLSGTFLKASQKGAPGKASVRGQVSVSNSSNQDTGLFFVRFYLSDDRELSADDVQIGKDRLIKTLKAGKSRKIGFAAGKLPQSAQGKHVIAVIDPQGLVDSANPGTQRVVSDALP